MRCLSVCSGIEAASIAWHHAYEQSGSALLPAPPVRRDLCVVPAATFIPEVA